MAIRLSGMNSGLDTDAIVTELVKAKSSKKTKLEQEQKKLSWSQDAWKSLNTKIYNFYSKTLSNARFQSDYYKKVTKASNSAVSVSTTSSAPDCVQTLRVIDMATSGYQTGEKLTTDTAGNTVTSSTKMSDLGIAADTKIKVTANGNTTEITLTSDMTLSNFASKLSETGTGLTANFDSKNGRFFISSNTMGEDGDFSFDMSNTTEGDAAFEALKKLGLADYETVKDANGDPVLDGAGNPVKNTNRVAGGTKLDATNAVIELNGATFESNKNTFDINGLSITINNRTSEEITLTTQADTDGIYDMVKNLIKEYNTLINEMDKLYNADSASKYKMLSDDEKEAMSDDEVKEWEDKIKSALLKGDSTLGTVSNAMKQIMLQGISVSQADGSSRTMYLSDFGIATAGYFSSADNEKNAYHIDGDSDDSVSATNEDKLKAQIASDPESVAKFFAGLSRTLYTKLDSLMSRTDYSSAFTVYNDKQMTTQYNDYKTKISDAEENVTKWEDFYYNKFTRMEKALANMQSAQNSLSGLFGS